MEEGGCFLFFPFSSVFVYLPFLLRALGEFVLLGPHCYTLEVSFFCSMDARKRPVVFTPTSCTSFTGKLTTRVSFSLTPTFVFDPIRQAHGHRPRRVFCRLLQAPRPAANLCRQTATQRRCDLESLPHVTVGGGGRRGVNVL